MFEYYGWITIHSSPGDEEDSDLNAAFAAAEREVQLLQEGTTQINLRWVNGMAQLYLSGFLNHRCGEGEQVLDAFQRIAKVAPGSYGLLYFHDDEDSSGRDNEFQVIVMRRGATTTHADGFLSPCIPIIEDE